MKMDRLCGGRALTFPFSWKSKQKSRGFPVFVVNPHFFPIGAIQAVFLAV